MAFSVLPGSNDPLGENTLCDPMANQGRHGACAARSEVSRPASDIRATCVLAARESADVADINPETVGMLKDAGQEAALIEMDTSKKADAKRMAGEAVEAFGTIDGIVCGTIYSPEQSRRGLRLSLVGPGPIHYVGQPARGRRSSGKQGDPHTG